MSKNNWISKTNEGSKKKIDKNRPGKEKMDGKVEVELPVRAGHVMHLRDTRTLCRAKYLIWS